MVEEEDDEPSTGVAIGMGGLEAWCWCGLWVVGVRDEDGGLEAERGPEGKRELVRAPRPAFKRLEALARSSGT